MNRFLIYIIDLFKLLGITFSHEGILISSLYRNFILKRVFEANLLILVDAKLRPGLQCVVELMNCD